MIKKIILITFIFSAAFFAQDLYELKEINFEGNNEISSSTLKEIILSEETPWWFWKFLNSFTSLGAAPNYFDSTNIPKDMDAMKEYYNANGFFEAKFSYKFDVDTSNKEVILTYIIEEKDPAHYRNFKLTGIDSIPSKIREDMFKEIQVDTTERYRQEIVQANITDATMYLHNNGYMLGRFDSTIVMTDTFQNKADLNVFYSPGKRYKIDTVLVDLKGEGAPYVKEELLSKITGIKIGEWYSAEKIRMSQVRLFRTGLFNSINLAAVEDDSLSTRLPLRLAGTIGKMNELSPEIIVNNQQSALNVGLGATYIRKNFLGEARKLTFQCSFGIQDIFRTQWGRLIERFSFRDTLLLGYVDTRLTIDQPYLFGKPIFGSWENYVTINKQKRFNNTIYGSKITFDYELPLFTFINRLSTSYNVEVSNEVYRLNNDSLSSKLISVIGADFGRMTADNFLFPTQGYNLSFQIEEANSLPYLISKVGDFHFNGSLFYKLTVGATGYMAINEKRTNIFAVKLKAGHLQVYNGDYRGVPINRTFFAGGSNSVRGWQSNQLIPKETPFIANELLGENVKGGTFLFEGSTELRLRFLESVGSAVFVDWGNTWLGYQSFRFDQVAIAAGLGLRYYSSVAPFRLDFGFKLYDPEDKKMIFKKPFWKTIEFHFGIGEAF